MNELLPMPPLGAFEPASGFSPDLPILLMFDEFIIDQEALNSFQRLENRRWLGQWPDVVAYLQSEGCLEAVDCRSVVREAASARSAMTRRDLRDAERWAPAMDFHDSLMASASKAFGDLPEESKAVGWKFDPGMRSWIQADDKSLHPLRALLTKQPPDELHRQLAQDARAHLRMQLAEVNAGIAAAMKLAAAPMFWAPYGRYLDAKIDASSDLPDGADRPAAARVFFEVAFPRFKPETVAELSKLRKDRRLGQLRMEIERAYNTGEALDKDYPQAILQEALRVDRRVGAVRKITGWISAGLGLLPGLGLPAAVGAEIASSIAEANARRRLDWLYMISDGVGST